MTSSVITSSGSNEGVARGIDVEDGAQPFSLAIFSMTGSICGRWHSWRARGGRQFLLGVLLEPLERGILGLDLLLQIRTGLIRELAP